MNLLGMHDREGAHIPPTGGWCLDTVALSENPSPLSYKDLRSDINWLVRLNWGYGSTGTFPKPENDDWYLDAALRYAVQSSGAYAFILGNEPNHQNERPDGVFLTPEYCASLFVRTRNAIKNIDSSIRVMPPPIAPYHETDMVAYIKAMYAEIERLGGEPDGIPIHAYTRGSDPADISSTEEMGAPLVGQFRGFLTYTDVLESIPARFSQTPAYITEFNEYEAWEDRNTGVVQAAVREIQKWNESSTQEIRSLILYRWPGHDDDKKWMIEGKQGVIEDFRAAIALGEIREVSAKPHTVHIPVASTATVQLPEQFERSIEQDASLYGVKVQPFPTAGLRDGALVWVAERVERLHEKEGEGRHHFYFETVDENGQRIPGISIKVWWPTDDEVVYSEEKPGEPWSANYPFSPGKNAFSARILNNHASDTVSGAGMGEDYPEGFNANVHSSITVRWVRRSYRSEGVRNESRTKIIMPRLVHPVVNSEFRKITQIFGVNRSRYSHFKVDGVSLLGHNGIDFGTPVDTPIQAVAEGRVVEVADEGDKGYGRYVKLSHPWGESLYAHLSIHRVSVGDRVVAGQIIGLSGNTGNSTGPHLHFGLRVSPFNRRDGWGGFTDPLPHLSFVPSSPVSSYDLKEIFKSAAQEFQLEWQLLSSLAWAESSFNPTANSGFARGILQIGAETWNDWAERTNASNIEDPRDNVRVGANYLRFLLLRYDNNFYKALWAYNVGPGNVDVRKVPPETKEFANKVLHGRDLLKALGV